MADPSAAGSDSPSDQLKAPSIESMMPTFRFMLHRKLRRKAHGEYRRHSSRRYLFSAIVIALFMSLIGIGAQKLELATSWPELALIVVLLLVMIYVVVKVSIVIRWCFYWLVLATLVLFAMNHGSLFEQFKSPVPSEKNSMRAKVVLIVLALLEGLTLGAVALSRFAYPRIVLRAKWLDCRWWWRVRDTPLPSTAISSNYRTVMFSYLSWDPDEYRLSRTSVSYVGEFNRAGQPHGLGEWTDHAFTGEALQGIWEHGVPIGPFKSVEYGSGNTFSSIRIGFCRTSSDKDDSTSFYSARDPEGPSYGAAAVECSVSGKFFHHLPHVRMLAQGKHRSEILLNSKDDGDTPTVALLYPLAYLSTFSENLRSRPSIRGSFGGLSRSAPPKSIVIRYTDRGLFIPGYIPRQRHADRNSVVIRRVTPPQGIDNHSSTEAGVNYRASQGAASQNPTKAQATLLAPAGPLSHSQTPSSGSDNESDPESVQQLAVLEPTDTLASERRRLLMKQKKRRLNQTGLVVDHWRRVMDNEGPMAELAPRAGYEALVFFHGYNCPLTYGISRLGQLLALGEFPSHIQPFVFNWPASQTLGYFQAKKVGCSEDVAQDFRQFMVDLQEAGFKRVHILAHSMGARVFLSALRKGYLGQVLAERDTSPQTDPWVQAHADQSIEVPLRGIDPSSHSSLDMDPSADTIQLATLTLLNPDEDLETFLEKDYALLSKVCPHISLYADAHDGALFWSEVLGRKRSLGRHPRTLVDSRTGDPLDVDVIDTTSLDVNIHSIRHNFFNLNRMLVDDIYDIVVLGRRARERGGRLSSRWTFNAEGDENGEVYTFLCAPSYVVNK